MAAFEDTGLPRMESVWPLAPSLTGNEADADDAFDLVNARPAIERAVHTLPEVHMARRYRLLLLVAVAALGCAGDLAPGTPPPPPPNVRLKEIVIPSLPSPYYRFEYDSTGKVTFVSFASDLRTYDIHYEGNRISEMQSIRPSRERLTYSYDESGKVSRVTYSDDTGAVYVRINLTYAGERLVMLERERRVEESFQPDKRMSFVYDVDGNLAELTDQRLPFPGQTEATLIDHFEHYEAGINVDGFDLIHSEFFDHVVLLPGVRLQLGNPGGVTRSGDGLNYHVDYTYTYDGENRPLTKHGEVLILNGTSAGQRFETNSTFSYE